MMAAGPTSPTDMKKYLIAITTIVLLVTALSLNFKDCDESTEAQAAVVACFGLYKKSLVEKKGDIAVTCVTQETIDQFDTYRQLALSAEKLEIDRLSLIDKLQVMLIRHRVPLKELREFKGKDLFAYAVSHGMVGKVSHQLEPGDFNLTQDKGYLSINKDGKFTGDRFVYIKENNEWKHDMMATIRDANQMVLNLLNESGKTTDAYILYMLEVTSGIEPKADVWTPPLKK